MFITKFYIIYDLGVHHVVLCVSDCDFYKVIDELSKEFEITKSNYDDNGKLVTSYIISQYTGDYRVVGFSRDEELTK